LRPTITVCTTCRHHASPADADELPAGARLAERLEAMAGERRVEVGVRRHECLWACREGCAILVSAEGRTGYIAGRFAPTAEAAAAILDWVAAYGQSPDGSVRYALWPEGMKGHFIARMPDKED